MLEKADLVQAAERLLASIRQTKGLADDGRAY